jgi:hypothetical protein
MRLLTRVILAITVAVLGGIQAAIFTMPVSYYYSGRNPGDIFGLGDGIAAMLLELEALTIVFTAVSVFLASVTARQWRED